MWDIGTDQNETGPVGLVVVSHSQALARAAVALAAEMLQGRSVRIEVAAGLDETTFGTDAVRIQEAIERADGPAGVVVLMDLGSAVLSTELALELLADPAVRDRVTLSAAPIVEGLIVAAVAAAGGATRAEVAAEARDALLGKAAHLSAGDPDVASGDETSAMGEVAVFAVANPHGLHARPAARLVNEVRGLEASVWLRNLTTGAGPVPAASLSRVATLGALLGHEIEVRASGRQAHEAVERLLVLAGRRFDEPAEAGPVTNAGPAGLAAAQADPPLTRARAGLGGRAAPGAPGIAIGPARFMGVAPVDLDRIAVGGPAAEWRRLEAAVADVRRDIEHQRDRTRRVAGAVEASIFDAHLALLADAELLADVRERISRGRGAARAWADAVGEVTRQWARLPDPYLRERAQDVRAVGDQVLRALAGTAGAGPVGAGILVATDLTPGEAAGLDLTLVRGVVLAAGSASSHAAILARALGIPLVVDAGRDVLTVPDGTTLGIDGGAGVLHVNPAADVVQEFRRRADAAARRRARDLADAQRPAVTRDGTPFVVAANVGSVADGRAALAAGAEGAGLVRTEFLYLGRGTAPEVEEQAIRYAAIAEAMGGRRITLRTMDIGGDKPLTYLSLPPERNPFLGLRGIRVGLDRPRLLIDQLDAICRAARQSLVSVMFPMVSTLGELLEARRLLVDASGPDGLPTGLRVGMMVEVPAAALKIETFLPHLDFVSIGTNDLTQYALAAERGNASVATLSDPLDPGVLALIDRVCRAADGRVEVAVCGEAASDELAIPVLLGLGVRELSVSPYAVPGVKAAVRQLDAARCRDVAAEALTLADAAEVRALVRAFAEGPG